MSKDEPQQPDSGLDELIKFLKDFRQKKPTDELIQIIEEVTNNLKIEDIGDQDHDDSDDRAASSPPLIQGNQ